MSTFKDIQNKHLDNIEGSISEIQSHLEDSFLLIRSMPGYRSDSRLRLLENDISATSSEVSSLNNESLLARIRYLVEKID